MVVECEMLSSWQRAAHREEVNWAPRSEVMTAGTPNRTTHPEKNALAQSAEVTDASGSACGHRVVLSTTVNRYR